VDALLRVSTPQRAHSAFLLRHRQPNAHLASHRLIGRDHRALGLRDAKLPLPGRHCARPLTFSGLLPRAPSGMGRRKKQIQRCGKWQESHAAVRPHFSCPAVANPA
jgi:hypothetical protein